MRLITFQDMELVKEVLANKAAYSTLYHDNVIQKGDRKYHKGEVVPVYAYASLSGLPICLTSIIAEWSYLGKRHAGKVMLELEVPTASFTCMRQLRSDKCVPTLDMENTINNLDALHESVASYEVLLKCLKLEWIVTVRTFDSTRINTTVINEDLIPLWNVAIDIKNRKWFYDGRNLDDIFYQDRILPTVCHKDTGVATGMCNCFPIDTAYEIAAEFGYSGPLGMLEWLKEINYPTFRQLEQITGKTFFTAQKKEK